MDLENGLVLLLCANEGSGTKCYDKSPFQNHGTLVGATHLPTWVNGKVGKAINYDGIDDCVRINNHSSLQQTKGDLTISLWVSTASLPYAINMLCEKYWNAEFALMVYANGQVRLAHGTPNEEKTILPTGSIVTTNTWQHVIVTRNMSTMKLTGYLNGKSSTPVAFTSTPTTSTQQLYIGAEAGTVWFYNGIIDEVRVYNRVLSAEEVQALYKLGQFNLDYGLVLHLPLNEGSGTKAYDQSPNKNHGTLVNSPTWVDGRLGSKVINLDGINQYIRCYDDSSFDVSSFTLTAWIYPSGNTGLYRMIFNRRGAGDPVFYFAIDNGEKLRIVVYVPDYTGYASATSISQNIWQFVTVTYNGSNGGIKIYINGKSDIQATVGTSLNTSISDICLGIEGDGSAYPFVGKISNARMYNRILSVEEIQALYQWGRYWDDI